MREGEAGTEPKGFVYVDRVGEFEGQPRSDFDVDRIEELAASMEAHGLLAPIVVSALPGGRYSLIDGARRVRAAKRLGWPLIAAVIRRVESDDDQFTLAVVANTAREDLNPVEMARAIRRVWSLPRYRDLGTAVRNVEVGKVFGRSSAWVNYHMLVLRLEPGVQGMVEQGEITAYEATSWSKLPWGKQREVAAEVRDKSPTVPERILMIERVAKRKSRAARYEVHLKPGECLALQSAVRASMGCEAVAECWQTEGAQAAIAKIMKLEVVT